MRWDGWRDGDAAGEGGVSRRRAVTAIQGLRNKFQMTGANHYLMTLIKSKTVQFFIERFWKIDRCKGVFWKTDGCNCTRCTRPNGALAIAAGHCTLPYPKSRSARVLFPEKELIHLADTTSANLSQIQGRELHNVTVQKTLISIYTNAWHWALPKLGGHFHSCFSRSSEDLPKTSLAPSSSHLEFGSRFWSSSQTRLSQSTCNLSKSLLLRYDFNYLFSPSDAIGQFGK